MGIDREWILRLFFYYNHLGLTILLNDIDIALYGFADFLSIEGEVFLHAMFHARCSDGDSSGLNIDALYITEVLSGICRTICRYGM